MLLASPTEAHSAIDAVRATARATGFAEPPLLTSVPAVRRAIAVMAILTAIAATPALAASSDLAAQDHLKRCAGTIHAGFTSAERKHASRYARYARISCARARAIVRLVDHTNGSYPPGYYWETPHGSPASYPQVFGHPLRATYLAPDGYEGSKSTPGVAVVLF